MNGAALFLSILAVAQPPGPADPPPPTDSPATVVFAEPSGFGGGGSFAEVGAVVSYLMLAGPRGVPAVYPPLFPGRVPRLNFGDASAAFTLPVRIGFGLGQPWGGFVAGASITDARGELIYANDDPLLARITGNPVLDALNRPQGPETADSKRPPIRPGAFDPAGAALVHTHVTRVTADAGYGNRLLGVGRLELAAEVGGRLGVFYVEDRSQGFGVHTFAGTHFVGTGPYLTTDWKWWGDAAGGGGPRFAGVYVRVGAAALSGRVRQTFREVTYGPYPRRLIEWRDQASRVVPTMDVEAGVALRAGPQGATLHLAYRFDRWWAVGGVGPDRFDLAMHGLAVRWLVAF